MGNVTIRKLGQGRVKTLDQIAVERDVARPRVTIRRMDTGEEVKMPGLIRKEREARAFEATERAQMQIQDQQDRKLGVRIWNTGTGTGKSILANNMDAVGTLYQAGQSGRSDMDREILEGYQHQIGQSQRALEDMLSNDGLSYEDLLAGLPEEDGFFSTKRKDYLASQGVSDPAGVLAELNILEAARRNAGAMEESLSVQPTAGEATREIAEGIRKSGDEDTRRAKKHLGATGQFFVDVGSAGAQMAADVALGRILGVSALAPMAAQSFGGAVGKARQEGASIGQQLAYGAGSAALSVGTEKLANVAGPFRKAFGKGVLDDALSNVTQRLGQSTAGRVALSALSEGGEELVEDFFQPILQRATYDKDASFDLEQALYDAAIGATLGGIGGVAEVAGKRPQQLSQAAEPQRRGTEQTQAERTKEAAPKAETANENGLTALTEQEKINLSSGKRDKIISTFQEAIAFIRNALSDRQNVDRAYLGKIPEATAKMVLNETGMDIFGYRSILAGDNVRHIMKNHGKASAEATRGQVAVTENDIALIPNVLSSPDKVYLSPQLDSRGRNVLIFEKKIGDNYVTMQAVTDGTHSLQTDTLYKQKTKNSQATGYYNASKIADPAHNAQSVPPQSSSLEVPPATADETDMSPGQTPETDGGPTLPIHSILQPAPGVKRDLLLKAIAAKQAALEWTQGLEERRSLRREILEAREELAQYGRDPSVPPGQRLQEDLARYEEELVWSLDPKDRLFWEEKIQQAQAEQSALDELQQIYIRETGVGKEQTRTDWDAVLDELRKVYIRETGIEAEQTQAERDPLAELQRIYLLETQGSVAEQGLAGAAQDTKKAARFPNGAENRPLTEADLEEYLQVGERQHVRDLKMEQIRNGRAPILTTIQQVKDFIRSAMSGDIRDTIKAYGRVGDRMAGDIRTKGGIDVTGYYLELDANRLNHLSDHIRDDGDPRNIPLTREQVEDLTSYIDSYDEVLDVVKRKDGSVRVTLGKRINGHAIVVELISKGRRSIQPVTAWQNTTEHYLKKYGDKKSTAD